MGTAEEIIRRAMLYYNASLKGELTRQAQESYDASLETRNAAASRAAAANARACRDAAGHIGYHDAGAILDHCDTMVVTLNAAGKVMGLSRRAINAAAAQWHDSAYAHS